jgi:hypothetical protein
MPATEVLEAIEPYERLYENDQNILEGDYLIINKPVIADVEEEYPRPTQDELQYWLSDIEPDCN